MRTRRIWTEEEIEVLVENYPYHSNSELAKAFNRSEGTVSQKAIQLGLKKLAKKEKTCKVCNNTYPNNHDYFGVANRTGTMSYCLECGRLPKELRNIKIRNRKEIEETNEWEKSIANNEYYCKRCDSTKLGKDMTLHKGRKTVAIECKSCSAKRNERYRLEQWRKGRANNDDNHN